MGGVEVTLYDLGEQYVRLQSAIDDNGEITPELDTIFATFAENEAEKLEAYRVVMELFRSKAELAEREAKAFRDMQTRNEKAIERMKARVKDYLEKTGRTRAETSTGRVFAIQRNGGKEPLVYGDDFRTDLLPKHLTTVAVTPNTAAIREAIEAGQPVPGVTIGERGTQLRVK
ncbi:MAG: hypothetical protein EKK55_07825 [Rhodocyclaceae bacterium]|nr:MAG: hypothetical protein EKK55_07825 [Rhodocyclaceae bacterium]